MTAIMRAVEDPDFGLIDLELDGPQQVEAFLAGLRQLWGRLDFVRDPRARIVELVEEHALAAGATRA